MSLADERTISVATFRKSGERVATPVWVVPLSDGRFGFSTSSASGKAKRLRNNPAIEVTPCNTRGIVKPGATTVRGTATLVTSGPDLDAVKEGVKAKYGIWLPITRGLAKLAMMATGKKMPYGDIAVVFTVDA